LKVSYAIRTGASVLAVLWAGQALAQDAGSAAVSPQVAAEDPAEIVVTASRRAQSLQDAPMSLNVATGEELQKYNLFDTKDIGRLAPGLDLTNTTGRNNTIALRGIGFDPDQGTGPTVQTYLNEVPTNPQTIFTALYDVGQIEVLRGPQGLLRGLSSPGGAITIATRRPDFDHVTGYAQATGTDRNAYNAQFGVSLPFSDSFAIRVAGVVDGNRLNQVRNLTRDEHSRSRTQSGRITFGWKPSADFTAFLTYQYLYQDNRQFQQVAGPGNTPVAVPFGDPTPSGPPIRLKDYASVTDGVARFENESHLVNLNANWDLGPATLAFVGGYQASKLHATLDGDGANAIPGYMSTQNIKVPFYVKTAELRLSSNDNGFLGWGLGAFYQKTTGTTVSRQRSDSFFGPFPISAGLFLPISSVATIPVDAEIWSFNASARAEVGQFTLEGGLRYTIDKSTRVSDVVVTSPGFPGIVDPFTSAISGIPAGLRNQDNRPVTGGATLTWQPSRSLTAYLSYGHSFRSGSVGVAVPVGVSNDLIASSSEKTDSFEIGVKGTLFDRRLGYTLSAFYQKFDGFLSRFPVVNFNCPEIFNQCNPAGPPINNATDQPPTNGTFDFNYNGDATVKGIEASIDARPTDFWDIALNASYTKARYKKGVLLPCNDFNGDGVPDGIGAARISGSGNVSFCHYRRLADLPNFSLTASTELRLPTVGAAEPFVRGLLTYRPSVFSERTAFELPSRTLIDLFVGARFGERWEISAFVKNVLNQRRITRISIDESQIATQTPGAPYRSGYRLINATNPREFGLTSRFNF